MHTKKRPDIVKRPLRFARQMIALALMVLMAPAWAQTDDAAEPITLKIQHAENGYAPIAAFFLDPWAAQVSEASTGALQIEIHDEMKLGGDPAFLFDLIAEGVVDGGWFPARVLGARYPAAAIFELPFATHRNAAASSRAAWEFTDRTRPAIFDDLHLIAVGVNGPLALHGRGKRIKSAGGFADVPIYAETEIGRAFFAALGSAPVEERGTKAIRSLIRGRVEAIAAPWSALPGLDLLRHTGIQIEPAGTRTLLNELHFLALNRAAFAALPKELRAVITAHSGAEISAWAGRAMDQGTELGRAAKSRLASTNLRWSPAATRDMRRAADAFAEEWITGQAAAGYPAREWYDLAGALIRQYAGD